MPGPQCKFDQWTAEEKEEKLAAMIEIAARGGHQSEMCLALGIKSEDTFYKWKREIPEFKAMCDEARLHGKSFYDNLLLRGGAGLVPNFNATAIMGIVNNKFPEDYRRNPNGVEAIQNNGTINILNISSEELTEKIQMQMAELRTFGIDVSPALIEKDDND